MHEKLSRLSGMRNDQVKYRLRKKIPDGDKDRCKVVVWKVRSYEYIKTVVAKHEKSAHVGNHQTEVHKLREHLPETDVLIGGF